MKQPGVTADSPSIQAVRDQLASIPPEDRHSPIFFFVKGLLSVASNESEQARKNFEHAISMDPNFIEARRELNVLRLTKTKSNDLLKADLKDVVGALFGKRK